MTTQNTPEIEGYQITFNVAKTTFNLAFEKYIADQTEANRMEFDAAGRWLTIARYNLERAQGMVL